MATLPRVTYQARYEHMLALVQESAQFVATGWFTMVKRQNEELWFDVCNLDVTGEDDSSGDDPCYAALYELFVSYVQSKLPAEFFDEIVARTNSAITYLEVMQASMMEPHDEAAVWDAWDRQDAQQAFDDNLAMYLACE